MKMRLYKQFKTYNIRCVVCGLGKPKDDFDGSWRVCKTCKQKQAKARKVLAASNTSKR